MSRPLPTVLLVPLLAGLLQAQVAPASAPTSQGVPGGYNAVPTDTPMVLEARQFIQACIPALTLEEVTQAYLKVVEGYDIKFVCRATLEDGPSLWEFVAYQSPDGNWRLLSALRLTPGSGAN